MLKSIYKITNNINNKCYIGQTSNIKSRFADHKRNYQLGGLEEDKLLYKAIRKYGIENFSFEVIEEDIENYNEREKYWISFYNSYKNGYNMTPGGEEPPIQIGEENFNATHTQKQVNEIKRALRESSLPLKEIAKQFNYDVGSISRINIGKLWYDDEELYPIRPESSKEAMKKRALLIINDLQNTELTQKEIGEKYGLGRSTITAINRGQNYHQDNINYPIRNRANNKQTKTILMIDKKTKQVLKDFDSIIDAAIYLGDKSYRSSIGLCLNGSTKSAHGYYWKYKE